MRKILIFLFITTLFFTFVPQAGAHFILKNNNIGVLIHLEPDDSPFIGESSRIHLDFQDPSGQLTNTNCACSLEISRDGKTLATIPITELEGTEHSFMTDYIFDEKGIYLLKIDGLITGEKNISFQMNYDLRVDRSEKAPSTDDASTQLFDWKIVGISVVFIILAMIGYRVINKK